MNRKSKLELTWIGKEHRPKLEPRILIEDPEKSYHAEHRVTDDDVFNNQLICGDNLLALKALEHEFTGKVKCVFIDPPYNTGTAFAHYDDGVEHSIWLSLMRERLELLRRLLSDDGSLWITIDDNEAHYLKVLGDEVFGRRNFLANVIWEKSDSPRMDAQFFSTRHDHLLVFCKNADSVKIRRIGQDEEPAAHYDRIDDGGRRYYLKPLRAMGGEDAREDRPSLFFAMVAPDGTEVWPKRQDGSDGRWRWSEKRTRDDRQLLEWVEGRNGWTPYYRIFAGNAGRPPETIWTHGEVGSNRTSKAEIKALFEGAKSFETPKPEALLARIITIATGEGDIVLDSFAGSGTTGAVAHKMRRRWLMVELGEHCQTLIIPRLQQVIDGRDDGGITQLAKWRGGGGFRYYRLAPSLLERDKWGNWVINKTYNAAMLSEALCKLEGFTYQPSDVLFWQQGHSTERDFIYVTTQHLTHEQLQQLSADVGTDRSLLVMCTAFRGKAESYPNLTIKRIPRTVLSRCEWGRDDYSLEVANLGPALPSSGQQDLGLEG